MQLDAAALIRRERTGSGGTEPLERERDREREREREREEGGRFHGFGVFSFRRIQDTRERENIWGLRFYFIQTNRQRGKRIKGKIDFDFLFDQIALN